MHLLLNRKTWQLHTLYLNRSHDVDGTGQHIVRLYPQGQCQIMYFHVNASPP